MESWISTYSGGKVDPINPDIRTIRIIDIGHALSMICRYNGHCKSFYSVAEHSVRLSRVVPIQLKRVALFHDAAEAYMSDLCRPVKLNVSNYRNIEDNLLAVIFEKYALDFWQLKDLKYWDNKLLITEAMQLMENIDGWGSDWPEPFWDYNIEPWSQSIAKDEFLEEAAKAIHLT